MVSLPGHLVEQIRVGRAVLILGAGASRDSTNRQGRPVALADEVASIFASAAGLPYQKEELSEVLQATTGSGAAIGDEQK